MAARGINSDSASRFSSRFYYFAALCREGTRQKYSAREEAVTNEMTARTTLDIEFILCREHDALRFAFIRFVYASLVDVGGSARDDSINSGRGTSAAKAIFSIEKSLDAIPANNIDITIWATE